jgi:trk system potassium uptake protein TrkA
MRIHFAGGGHCAEYVARRLIREGHDLVLMEHDEQRCGELQESLDAQVILGDVTRIAAWRQARLARTDMFVACTDMDERNVLACMIANDLAPQAVKAVRLHTSEYADWHRMLGAMGVKVDRVVHPESDIVARIMRVLALPGVSDIRDFANGRVKVFSMNITRRSELAGQPLQALAQLEGAERQKVCLIFRNNQAIVPEGEERLLPGDHIYVVTASTDLEAALTFMSVPRRERVHEVFIVGGGEIGLELARSLETEKVAIKLFERDLRRCDYLAEQLADTVVIRADGTDQETLLRENIEGADAFITLTADDDDNLIACLLARQLGVDKVVPMLNRVNYLPLAQRLGINTSVSRHVKAADALFEFIRKGGVLSVRTLGEEQAEAIELEVPAESSYVGKPLAQIDFPIGTQVGAIVRPDGVVVVPNDTFVLHARDRAVLFAQEQAVRRLESTVLAQVRSSRWLL